MSSPSEPTVSDSPFGCSVDQDVMTAMRDGICLAADIYWPVDADGQRLQDDLPTILVRTSYNKTNVWSGVEIKTTVIVNGNPWVFVKWEGKWYAATWEWLRVGQTCKSKDAVAGDHIKQAPFNASSGWKPTSGQAYWIMVSAPARMGQMTVAERSNLVKVIWP